MQITLNASIAQKDGADARSPTESPTEVKNQS